MTLENSKKEVKNMTQIESNLLNLESRQTNLKQRLAYAIQHAARQNGGLQTIWELQNELNAVNAVIEYAREANLTK
jgi:hypothetical protein